MSVNRTAEVARWPLRGMRVSATSNRSTDHQSTPGRQQSAHHLLLLFCTRTWKPLSPTNIIRRHLHLALKELNYMNPYTGTHKDGNHAFRRFRNTYLRNYTECPEGLYKYWMGHAGRDMSDLYDKVKEDVAFSRKWQNGADLGSSCPQSYRMYRKWSKN